MKHKPATPNRQLSPMRVELGEKTAIKCPECGTFVFELKHQLHFLSRLQSPQGRDEIVPLEAWQCAKCRHSLTKMDIDQQFNPKTEVIQ